jgi:hypothetical protein
METTIGGHSRLTLLDEGGTDKGSKSDDEALEKQ